MIKVENVYRMLAYAFRNLTRGDYRNMNIEDFSFVSDLFAEIFVQELKIQLQKGLYKEYVPAKGWFSSPLGRIDFSKPENQHQVWCAYEEYSEDCLLNQIVKTAGEALLRAEGVKPRQRNQLFQALGYFQNVRVVCPREICWEKICYNPNNEGYQLLIAIARLFFDGKLLSQEEGSWRLRDYLDDQELYYLFENFVRNYYRHHYPQLRAGREKIPWADLQGDMTLNPMVSDTVLHQGDRTVIIDTKWYSSQDFRLLSGGRVNIPSDHIQQIYAYVKNRDTAHTGKTAGVLLYAKTEASQELERHTTIGGNPFFFYTVDLNRPFGEICGILEKIRKLL